MGNDEPWRSPRVPTEPLPQPSLLAMNYDAIVGRGVENTVNLGSSGGISVFISHNAASGMAGIGTLSAEAYVIHGDPEQARANIQHTIDMPSLPIDAERILAWITKPERLEFLLDTWEVNFQIRIRQDGQAAAKAWLWWQVTRTFGESVLQISPRIAAFIYLLRRIMSLLFGS